MNISRLARLTFWLPVALSVQSAWAADPAEVDPPLPEVPSLQSLRGMVPPDPSGTEGGRKVDLMTDYVLNRQAAILLGKALFWDMEIGSDGSTACAPCHYHAGVDHRRVAAEHQGPDPLGIGRERVRSTRASMSRSTRSFQVQPAPRMATAPTARRAAAHRASMRARNKAMPNRRPPATAMTRCASGGSIVTSPIRTTRSVRGQEKRWTSPIAATSQTSNVTLYISSDNALDAGATPGLRLRMS